MVITPSVGRVVWYYKGGLQAVLRNEQPMAALVAYVHGDRMVNLAYFDHNGEQHSATSVALVQEGDESPQTSDFCCWMPYQLGQAKKHAAA